MQSGSRSATRLDLVHHCSTSPRDLPGLQSIVKRIGGELAAAFSSVLGIEGKARPKAIESRYSTFIASPVSPSPVIACFLDEASGEAIVFEIGLTFWTAISALFFGGAASVDDETSAGLLSEVEKELRVALFVTLEAGLSRCLHHGSGVRFTLMGQEGTFNDVPPIAKGRPVAAAAMDFEGDGLAGSIKMHLPYSFIRRNLSRLLEGRLESPRSGSQFWTPMSSIKIMLSANLVFPAFPFEDLLNCKVGEFLPLGDLQHVPVNIESEGIVLFDGAICEDDTKYAVRIGSASQLSGGQVDTRSINWNNQGAGVAGVAT